MLELAMYEFSKWMMIAFAMSAANSHVSFRITPVDIRIRCGSDVQITRCLNFGADYRRDNRAMAITRKDRVNRRISP